MIPNKIEDKIKFVLNSKFGENPSILDVQSVSGGCINNSCKIISSCGEFFLKWNNNTPSEMFEVESRGLDLLRESNALYIPETLSYDKNYLLLDLRQRTGL